MGDNVCREILKQTGVQVSTQSATKITESMAKLISRELIADGVLVVVLTADDVTELLRGRISQEELLKNLTVTIITIAAGTAGGYGGAALGTWIAPGIGTKIGLLLGSVAAGGLSAMGAEALIEPFYKSDAEEMFDIINVEFTSLCEDYLINNDEGIHITDNLKNVLAGDKLKDMFASEDRTQFAHDMLEPLFIEEVKHRQKIVVPTEAQLRQEMKSTLHGIVFIH